MKFDVTLDILLRQVGKAHSNKINQVLDKVNMHKGQPMMLYMLYRQDGVPQSALAKEMSITPATVSAMVKRMEKAGYVIRRRDAVDERISNVYLTDAGKAISSELNDMQSDMDDIAFNGFSEDEKKVMKGYLERVLENLTD